MKKLIFTMINNDVPTTVEHEHKYSETYSYNKNEHWKECSCGEKTSSSEHLFGVWLPIEDSLNIGSKKRICSVCGYEEIKDEEVSEHTHVYSAEWKKDDTYHWNECSCGEKTNIEKHDYSLNGSCKCGLVVSKGLNYTLLSDDTYEVSGIGVCEDSNIVIPSIYVGRVVTSIGNSAFSGCSRLTSITIPNSVTSIGDKAFYNCSSLTSVTIGSGVKSIGKSAFDGCSSLKSITIPNSVTSIGNIAFYGCSSLVYNEYDNGYYLGNDTNSYLVLVKGKSTDITSCKINENTKIICSYAFYNCSSLKSITIPNSVTSIGDSAFSRCSSLKSITITEGVTSIGDYAFYDCSSLTSIEIPNSVTSIGSRAFVGCCKLVEVYNLSTLNITKGSSSLGHVGYHAKVIHTFLDESSILTKTSDGYIFMNYNNEYYLVGYEGNDTELILPNDINGYNYKIYDYAFDNCSSLTSITIPEGVTSIGDYAFWRCSSLTSIVIPNSVTSIGEAAFWFCSSLTNITIPNSVTSIGEAAFRDCSSLRSITIPNSVTSIGSGAFAECSSLVYYEYDNGYYLGNDTNPYLVLVKAKSTDITSCEINTNTKIIYYCAFDGCSSLTNITIPNSVTSVGKGAFSGCSSLTSITIPFVGETLEGTGYTHFGYIFGSSTYSSNSSYVPSTLKEVIITGGTKIGSNVFYGCSSLKSITIPEGVTSIGYRAFYGCNSLTSIEIPNSVTSIGWDAFSGCSSLTSITIPDSVTSIEYGAFSGCSSLKSITIPEGVTSIGYRAFYGCNSLTSITIPNSVTSIGNWAFSGCSCLVYNEYDNGYYLGNDTNPYLVLVKAKSTDITSCEINTNTKIIYYCAFDGCSSLTSITIPNSVTSIEGKVFSGCSSLTSITIPDSVTSIEYGAFDGCSSLTSITIPNSVTSIGAFAFDGCSSLTSIVIPNSVTSIGESAFSGCSRLTSVYYEGSIEEWNSISIDSYNNTYLTNANRYYYSETKPIDTTNKYWYYVDGVITIWE